MNEFATGTHSMSHSAFREAVIDLDALTQNVRHLVQTIDVDHVLIVVKADAYGHGMIPCAKAAVNGGATWLGVADVDEAMALRTAGIVVPILAWLHAPDETFVPAIAKDITLGLSSVAQLEAAARAATQTDRQARVHLKLDTGLSRNGASALEWPEFFAKALELEQAGSIVVEGIFSHLSNTSEADDDAAGDVFDAGVVLARKTGLKPTLIHLAASSTALSNPKVRYNMVRLGITAYGVSPFTSRTPAELGLTPVMTLRSRVIASRWVEAGVGISYDYTSRTTARSHLALIPLGYAEGIPRQASNRGPIVIGNQRYVVAGRVAMDQFIVNTGDTEVPVGTEVVIFGDPQFGHPSVQDWAEAADTIGYEIVTRIGGRVQRRFVGLG